MKKQLFAASLVTIAAACGSKSAPSTTTAAAPPVTEPVTSEPAASPTPAPTTKGQSELGTWGFDSKGMNGKVSAGASFYEHANGGWLRSTPIPADKSNYGMFTVLSDRSDERTKDIILTASGEPHEGAADARRMERREREVLAQLGFGDPYSGGEGPMSAAPVC